MSPEETVFKTEVESLLTKLDELIKAVEEVGVEVNIESPDFEFEVDTYTYLEDEDIFSKTKVFLDLLKNINFPGGVIQYSLISQRVFSDKRGFDAVENIVERIKHIIQVKFNDRLLNDAQLARRCYKLLDHLLLASFQIGEIIQNTKSETENLTLELVVAKEEFEKSKIELDIAKKEIEEENKIISHKLVDVQEEFTKIYIQFVTILGIFTAIVVSIFGGLQIINESFSNLHLVPIWKTTLIISLFSIAILCMLTALTGWVSTIVRRVFENEYKPRFSDFIIHNGAFATGIYIFSYVALASVVMSSSKVKGEITNIFELGDSWPIIVVLAIPLIIGIGVFIKTIDLRKYKN